MLRAAWVARDLGVECDYHYVVQPRRYRWWNFHDVRHKVIPRALRTYAARKFSRDDEKFADSLNRRIRIAKDFEMVYRSSCPKDNPDTLWVFGADSEAAMAIDWADEQGIHIPGQLSIMGLQHSPSFFHRGLSLCGPDWDTIGYQMAHSLIGDVPVAKTGRGFIRSRAIVIEKLTTR